MNTMNDERFFDLAMKIIAQLATDAERAELNSLLSQEPKFKAEFERLQAETKLAREVVPLLAATESTAGEFPAYARGRLQTKVTETLGAHRPPPEQKRSTWRWQWIFGLATATAIILFLLVPVFHQSDKMIVQVAMLDTTGATRGAGANEIAEMQKIWTGATVQSFSQSTELAAWENSWLKDEKQPTAKIIYDRPAGEVRVLGRWQGKPFQKTFLIERDLETTLQEAKTFIRERTERNR